MKYSLKTISIGFECPIIDLKNETLNNELNSNLIDPRFNFFDILKNDLELLKLQNCNSLLLYTLVVLIDNELITPQHLEKEWKEFGESISDKITNYLKKQNIKAFRKII